MRIALISFEYPIDTNWGGIATYVQQAAYMLHNGGYEVEVFCGTKNESYTTIDDGVPIHLCYYDKRMEFYKDVLEQFKSIHEANPFDVIEVPEFATDAKSITALFPEIAVVVKTHSPSFLNDELNSSAWEKAKIVKHIIQSFRKRKRPVLPFFYSYKKDAEFLEAKKADLISSPSRSLEKIVKNKWNLSSSMFLRVPYPFKVTEEFLNCKIEEKTKITSITYVGRLEIRKGILTLAKAVRKIAERYPNLSYVFIGQAQSSPNTNLNMREYLEANILGKSKGKCHFTGKLSKSEIIEKLNSTDLCIFPSIWENFPNVCLEAMSAGKAIIASKEGGMSDMITHLDNGYLINPNSSDEILEAVEYFIKYPEKVAEFGNKARKKVLEAYSPETILPQQIALYTKAIEIRQNKLRKSE